MFTRGTQCLNEGDYPKAVEHLSEAVRLDPTMSRNHNNLASAYVATGQIALAWEHSRKAINCWGFNPAAELTFIQLYKAYAKECKIGLGSTRDYVFEKLGKPDRCESIIGNTELCYYGSIKMEFVDGKLASVTQEPIIVL